MYQKLNTQKIALAIYYLLVVISFSFPFGRQFTSPLLIMLFSAFLIFLGFRHDRTLKAPLMRWQKFYLLLPASYYLLCIVGLLFTTNLKAGFYELDKKITLFALPVLFLFIHQELSTNKLEGILKGFVAGVTASGCISICLGFYHSTSIVNGRINFRTAVNDFVYLRGDSFFEQVTQGGNFFFGPYISPFIHTNYYGLYLSFGCIISIYFFLVTKKKLRYLIACLFLFCVLLLTDSRGPLISFLICLPLIVLLSVRAKVAKVVLPLIVAAVIAVLVISPRTSLLFSDLGRTIETVDYKSKESAMLRLVVWDAAIDIIRKNWHTGVGTGDREDEMLAVTKTRNKAAFEMRLNAHNQYLEAFMTFGIPGITIILAMILLPLSPALINRQNMLSAFLIVMGLNMLVESMLQVFQGIVFFSFFYCILILHFLKRNEITPIS